jgi:iron complex transport system substrate-binding protein
VWSRPGWEALEPVRSRTAHEIRAEIILQPGPAALTAGLDAVHAIIAGWSQTS